MPNFYLDNPDLGYHLDLEKHPEMARIIQLQEQSFQDQGSFDYAPGDAADALDSYQRILEIVGHVAGDFVAPLAREVDNEGAQLKSGEVSYARGTREALHRLTQAELMGFTLPRRYGGLNCPKTVYSLAIEMISRADASLMNLFGLQEIADTIYRFGSEEQKERILPRFSRGEVTGAMALTEPDAGSDLQAVRLKAEQDASGQWVLNGVKRFITNGCGHIILVLARSEAQTSGGRGLSLFVYERDEHMRIRRIEKKLGIHGSPTCELQFDDAPAELLGKRRRGLVEYTMSLMNGARLAVAAQAVGIAEAAFQEARKYAGYRMQFKSSIRNFPAVYEMLTEMKVAVEAGRTLMMETSRVVDLKENLEREMEQHPGKKSQLKEEARKYSRYAAFFTPAVKIYATEAANKVCYDALQIHGGTGYTRDFEVERLYRDVRITNIYEGTTQLQVLGAIGGLVTGVLFDRLDEYEQRYDFTPVEDLAAKARELRSQLEEAVSLVREQEESQWQQYHAGRLLDMANDTVISYLLCIDALGSKRKAHVASAFLAKAAGRCTGALQIIESGDRSIMAYHDEIIDQ